MRTRRRWDREEAPGSRPRRREREGVPGDEEDDRPEEERGRRDAAGDERGGTPARAERDPSSARRDMEKPVDLRAGGGDHAAFARARTSQ